MYNAYCTVMSKYRLFQGIALHESLNKNSRDFKMFVLCMDDETLETLKKLKLDELIPISVKDVEDKDLLEAKKNRTIAEYCQTMKPTLLLYVLEHYKDIQQITFVDADIYFYGDPVNIFKNQDECSVLLSRHDYTKDPEGQCDATGKYNSGIISFKRDIIALTVLQWWRRKCNEWCFVKIENGKYTDQKYLELFPIIFKNVCEINTPGVNIAFWNHGKYSFSEKNCEIYIDNDKLICYHYAYYSVLDKDIYSLNYGQYTYLPIVHDPYGKSVRNAIYVVEAVDAELCKALTTYDKNGFGPMVKIFDVKD